MAIRTQGLQFLAQSYVGILSDVWGVLHNGLAVYPGANEALVKYRQQGGRVVLITNSPRPRPGVEAQLLELGVSREAYDRIVTSGDVTRDLIASVEGGVFHLGPDRDFALYEGLNAELTTAEDANAIVCTGLFDDEAETPEDYRELLKSFADRSIPFICANPDLVVERGDRLIWCAGALAKLYEELGGEVRIAGKPHSPIYALAERLMSDLLGSNPNKRELLAIGDGLPTDVAGAMGYGSHLLYVTGGIHASEYGSADEPDEARLANFLDANGAQPDYWIPKLVW